MLIGVSQKFSKFQKKNLRTSMKDLRVMLEYDRSDLRRLENFKKSGNDIVFLSEEIEKSMAGRRHSGTWKSS